MKRNKPAKRRDRRTGESPYARHHKREFLYSSGYYDWRRKHTAKKANAEKEHRPSA